MKKIVVTSTNTAFIVPIILYILSVVLICAINPNNIVSKTFTYPLLPCLIMYLVGLWRSTILSLTDDELIIAYPFKIFFTKKNVFNIADIEKIMFSDNKDAKMDLPRVEISFYKDECLNVLVLSHDINYKKIQWFIDELRKIGLNVISNSSVLR